MNTKKFNIPQEMQSTLVPEVLHKNSKIQFKCHKNIACFNACCKEADVTLTPYDIVQMKKHFGTSSSDILKEYTVPFEVDSDGLPGLKMKTTNEGTCLQMTEEGCAIYDNRPSACRYYGLGVMAKRDKDSSDDYNVYFQNKEDICKGWDENHTITIKDYRKEQGVIEYDEMNREWMQLILKKKSAGPAVGKPSSMSLQLFFLACYDVDRFKRFLESPSFSKIYALPQDEYEAILNDDVKRMRFGFRFLKQTLFGENTIPMQDNAYEKRSEERKDIIEARYKAEVAIAQQKAEDARKAAEDLDSPPVSDCNAHSCG